MLQIRQYSQKVVEKKKMEKTGKCKAFCFSRKREKVEIKYESDINNFIKTSYSIIILSNAFYHRSTSTNRFWCWCNFNVIRVAKLCMFLWKQKSRIVLNTRNADWMFPSNNAFESIGERLEKPSSFFTRYAQSWWIWLCVH